MVTKGAVAKFMSAWRRDLAIVAAGGLLGLLVVYLAWDESSPPSGQARQEPSSVVEKPAAPKPEIADPGMEPSDNGPKTTEALRSSDRTPDMAASSPDERPAWQRFSAIHSPVLGRRMIAVIIDDMGLDRVRTARAIELTGPLTMSFLTYARNLRAQTATARSVGHELMIHLPMEPEDTGAYAGPKVIKRDLSEAEIRRRLDWAFGRFEGYVGINNHMGSRYTADRPGMTLVLSEIKRRGLLFVDSRTSPRSVAQSVARRLSLPFAERHIFLDDDATPGTIIRQLKALENIAIKQGFAIAIGHPYDTTLSALEKWLPTLASRGFVLVPVSAIVRHKRQSG